MPGPVRDTRPEIRPEAQGTSQVTSQVTSPYPASEYSDWESENTSEGDKTPTRAKESRSLTVEELQEAARKLNLCVVTPDTPDTPDTPPVVPPRQRPDTDTESEGNDLQHEESLDTECMNLHLVCPTSNNVDTTLQPTDTDNTDSTSDDESDCQTVRFNDKKGFAQTEMKFRDIYDDTVAILPSSSGNNVVDTVTTDNNEALEDADEKDCELLSSQLESNAAELSQPGPLYEKNSASTETLKTQNSDEAEPGDRKPRSSKKTRAPPPPVQQSSLVSPSDQIVHLSPATSRRDLEVTQPDPSPEPEAPVISAVLEAENGKVIYRSKGFDGETETKLVDVLPQKIVLGIAPSQLVDSIPNQELSSQAETHSEKQPATDQFPDRDWKFLGHSDTDDKHLLKPVQEKSAPTAVERGGLEHEREMYPSVSTRLFTYSPSTGVTKLRRYDLDQEYNRPSSPPVRGERPGSPQSALRARPGSPQSALRERPSSPLLPRSEYYGGSEVTGRCPHCTIHSWLPHSPGCLNKRK